MTVAHTKPAHRRACYEIVANPPGGNPLVIRDVGPWDQHLTVTNDAANVVAELYNAGLLPGGRRLFYIDSHGVRDEILHVGGVFRGFGCLPF